MTRDVDTDAAATLAQTAARLLRAVAQAAERIEADSLAPEASPEKTARAAGVAARATGAVLTLLRQFQAASAQDDEAADMDPDEAETDDETARLDLHHTPARSAELERGLRNLARNLGPWAERAGPLAGADAAAGGGLGLPGG